MESYIANVEAAEIEGTGEDMAVEGCGGGGGFIRCLSGSISSGLDM